MLHRDRFEVDYAEIFDDYGYATSIWSPLAGGLLTGKYLKEDKPTEGRLAHIGPHNAAFAEAAYHFSQWFGPDKLEKTKATFKELEEIAASLGGSLTQLAIAWILRNKDVSTIICAFSKASHVEENIRSAEMARKFTPEIDERIEKLLGNKPRGLMDWKKFSSRPSRRWDSY